MSLIRMNSVFYIAYIVLYFTHAYAETEAKTKESLVQQLNEENWNLMLKGEWMIEFYAPWCPACKALESTWEYLASSKEELNINVAKVDVTDSPGLSGRFLVTALPTIFHVNDGIFRQYKSPRDTASLIEFISEKTWRKVEPIPGWKNPTSLQMTVISQFFKLSQVLRSIHNKLLEDFGLPPWGSYLIFALVTILLGAMLGMLIVCVIDFIYPPKRSQYMDRWKEKEGSSGFMQEKGNDEDEIAENVADDLVDEEESEGAEEPEENEKDKDTKADTSSPNIRKRKPRKAD